MTGYGKPQDIFSTYEQLGHKEKRTLHGVACYYMRGTSFGGPLDLLHEALLRSAEGRRRWPLRMDFSAHIMLNMRSIADADRKQGSGKRASLLGFEEAMEWGAAAADTHPSAEEQYERGQDGAFAKRVISTAKAGWRTADDRGAIDVLDGMLEELSNADIGAKYGMAMAEVKAARKRVLRKLGTLARL